MAFFRVFENTLDIYYVFMLIPLLQQTIEKYFNCLFTGENIRHDPQIILNCIMLNMDVQEQLERRWELVLTIVVP